MKKMKKGEGGGRKEEATGEKVFTCPFDLSKGEKGNQPIGQTTRGGNHSGGEG